MWRIWTFSLALGAAASSVAPARAQAIAEPNRYYGLADADFRAELTRLIERIEKPSTDDSYGGKLQGHVVAALKLGDSWPGNPLSILDPDYERLAYILINKRTDTFAPDKPLIAFGRMIFERRLAAQLALSPYPEKDIAATVSAIGFALSNEDREDEIADLFKRSRLVVEPFAGRADSASISVVSWYTTALLKGGDADRAIGLSKAAFATAMRSGDAKLIRMAGAVLLNNLRDAERSAEAIAHLDEWAKLAGPDPRFAESLADVRIDLLADARRFAEAEKQLRPIVDDAAQKQSARAVAFERLAKIYRLQKRWNELRQLIDQGVQSGEPFVRHGYGRMGNEQVRLLIATGQVAQAQALLKTALDTGGFDAWDRRFADESFELLAAVPETPALAEIRQRRREFKTELAKTRIAELEFAIREIMGNRIQGILSGDYPLHRFEEAERLTARLDRLLTEHPEIKQFRWRPAYVRGAIALTRGQWAEAFAQQKLASLAESPRSGNGECVEIVTLHSIVKPKAAPLAAVEARCAGQIEIDSRRREETPALRAIVSGVAAMAEPGAEGFALDAVTAGLSLIDGKKGDIRLPEENSRNELSNDRELRKLGRAVFADALWVISRGRAGVKELEQVYTGFQSGMLDVSADAIAVSFAGNTGDAIRPGLGALTREYLDLAENVRSVPRRRPPQITTCPPGGCGKIPPEQAAAERMRFEREEADHAAMIAKRDARLSEVRAILDRDFPDFYAMISPAPLDLAETRAALKPDEAVLLITPTFRGTHVVAIDHSQALWKRSALKDDYVSKVVTRLMWDVGAKTNVPDAVMQRWEKDAGEGYPYARTPAYELYRELIEPALPVLAGKKRVFISTGGSLAALPFGILVAAKPAGSDGDPDALRATEWLADKFAIIRLPSIHSLKLLRGKQARRESELRFTGFGDPVLRGSLQSRGTGRVKGLRRGMPDIEIPPDLPVPDQVRTLSRLNGTTRELTMMRDELKQVGDAEIRLAAAATEPALFAADLRRTSILAFATHGLMAGGLPGVKEAALVMTPPKSETPKDDGVVTASEIAALKLDADWVILSACNTATSGTIGEAAPGFSALVNSFFFAGARSVLASHWYVDDEIAALLSVDAIKRRRADPGLTRAEALQQAMRAIRMNKSKDGTDDEGRVTTWAHPAAWAPFSIIGDVAE